MDIKVSFRIIADDLRCLEISEMLGIVPSTSHNKGDAHNSFSKKGKLIEYSPFSMGVWILESNLAKDADIESHFESLLVQIESSKDKLLKFTELGYKLDFFCGIYLNDCVQPSFNINPDILKRISDLNITVGMCFY